MRGRHIEAADWTSGTLLEPQLRTTLVENVIAPKFNGSAAVVVVVVFRSFLCGRRLSIGGAIIATIFFFFFD